jgi:hypothetical protein
MGVGEGLLLFEDTASLFGAGSSTPSPRSRSCSPLTSPLPLILAYAHCRRLIEIITPLE